VEQSEIVDLPELALKFPAAQFVHEEEPAEVENFPPAQGMQSAGAFEPVDANDVPAAQVVQED